MNRLPCLVAGRPVPTGPILTLRNPYHGEPVGEVITVGRAHNT